MCGVHVAGPLFLTRFTLPALSLSKLVAMATYLGIDISREPDLLWVARQAVLVSLPAPWIGK